MILPLMMLFQQRDVTDFFTGDRNEKEHFSVFAVASALSTPASRRLAIKEVDHASQITSTAAQQKAAGAALAAKRGEAKKGDLKGASKEMAESMTERELEHMASTKRKGKPRHVSDKA